MKPAPRYYDSGEYLVVILSFLLVNASGFWFDFDSGL